MLLVALVNKRHGRRYIAWLIAFSVKLAIWSDGFGGETISSLLCVPQCLQLGWLASRRLI